MAKRSLKVVTSLKQKRRRPSQATLLPLNSLQLQRLAPASSLRLNSFQRRSPRRVDQVTCFGLEPSQLDKARLYPSAPAMNSLKPWPALWPPTLAMKSQKPCSERWPLDAAARCASNAASEQTTAVARLCASPTARRRPLARLRSRPPARRLLSAFLRRRSPRRVNQATWPARATAPEQSFWAPTFAAAPCICSLGLHYGKTLARSRYSRRLRAGLCKPQAEQLRASVRRPLAKLSAARAQRSFGLKPAQLQLSQTFLRLNLTQLQRSTSASENRCSLCLNSPPPLLAAKSPQPASILAGLRKPQAAALQAPASQNKDANFKRLRCGLVVFARSSASLITRPAGLQIQTLNPKRFVSGRYWGGLKQPPRRAAPRPSGSRRAASEGKP